MFELRKRTEGKIKGCLTIRQMYKFYKSSYKDIVNYQTFAKVVKLCNKKLLDRIVNKAEKVQLPYRLGYLQIAKFERSFNQSQTKWSIDFHKSRQMGFKVYFEDKYVYKWCWKKNRSVVKNKSGYKFEACRGATRMVKPALKKGVDFFK